MFIFAHVIAVHLAHRECQLPLGKYPYLPLTDCLGFLGLFLISYIFFCKREW